MRSAMGSWRTWSIVGVVILAACLIAVMPSPAHADSISGSNGANVSIPDDDGWVYSPIAISEAPSGAIVTGIDCHFSCIHTYSGDLDIDLNDQGITRNYDIWSNEGGSADNPSRTVYDITTFNGLPVNGIWYLFAQDAAPEDTGYIDEWWITIYYTLSLPGEIHGSKWEDANGDAQWDQPGEPGLPNWKIYLDSNRNGQWDADEPFQMTDSNGDYAFTNLEPGKYFVAEVSQNDWEQTYPSASGIGVTQFAHPITTTGSKVPTVLHASGKPANGGRIVPQTVESGLLIRMDEFRADPRFAGIDGGGYAVAILDTGIDLDNPCFGPDGNSDGIADRIVFQHDFADNDDDASDHDGHGSNVSSIVASIAPAANIVALKVFTDLGAGNFGVVEQALQWVVNNSDTYNIVSVNMSLGDSENHAMPQTLYGIDDEIAILASRHIIVSCSSGNDFISFGSQTGVSYPAADPNAFSVGAVYDANTGGWSYGSGAIAYSTDEDRICPFSQRHPTLTAIFAPGAVITGANWNGGTVDMHGTSQAAPHIAGVGVLAQQLIQNALGRPLTNTEFEIALNASGVVINDGDDEDDNVTNTGLNFRRIDMMALGEAILAGGYPGRHKESIRSGDVVTGVNFGNRIPCPTVLPVVPTSCPEAETSCPLVATLCPAETTTCPIVETECPLIQTACPPVDTQCPLAATTCPAVATECPAAATTCPSVMTSCPEVPTECPVVATVCPPGPTYCPPVETECPPVTTACPAVVTECPLAATTCPAVATECPAAATTCPAVATECPLAATTCPAVATECPAVATTCPAVATECPVVATTCPAVATECPAVATTCPAVTTECPVVATTCPAVATECPAVATTCPAVTTECPAVATTCPPVVTQCPAASVSLVVQSTPITGVPIAGTPLGTTNYSTSVSICPVTHVNLTAPATVVRLGKSYWFVRWVINGVGQATGNRAVAFDINADTTAIANYKYVRYLKITGPTRVIGGTTVKYACRAYYSVGGSSLVTYKARWYENSRYARFLSAAKMKTYAVRSRVNCRITAKYGGVSGYCNIYIIPR